MVSKAAIRRSVPVGALPGFTPVPRKQPRHDGWTAERQRAFIEALADTGCVAIAARMVNMSQPGAYTLRRQPGAESFRAAWDAAQTLGLQPVKDEAFDRAMNGQLVPVFVAGKLMGFRRKKNDRLLMFILRHYGQDAQGRKTTVNYFSTRASAGAANLPPPNGGRAGERGSPETHAAAEASTTTVRTTVSGPDRSTTSIGSLDETAANILNAFEGVELDPEAQAAIYRALEACAERRRALEEDPENDPERFYIGEAETNGYLGELESGVEGDWVDCHPEGWQRPDGEHSWENLGEGGQAAETDRVVGEMQARLAAETPEARAAREAAQDATSRAEFAKANKPLPGYIGGGNPALPAPEPDPNDPRLDWRNWAGGGYAAPAESPSPLSGRGIEGEGAPPSPRRGCVPSGERAHGRGEGEDQPISPRTGRPLKRYKKRRPKPPFTPPTACPEPQSGEARKAEAVAEVEVERRELAAAEAERRGRRRGG